MVSEKQKQDDKTETEDVCDDTLRWSEQRFEEEGGDKGFEGGGKFELLMRSAATTR